jgi:hypothetical protein
MLDVAPMPDVDDDIVGDAALMLGLVKAEEVSPKPAVLGIVVGINPPKEDEDVNAVPKLLDNLGINAGATIGVVLTIGVVAIIGVIGLICSKPIAPPKLPPPKPPPPPPPPPPNRLSPSSA